MTVKHGVAFAVLAGVLLVSGCAHEAAPTPPPSPSKPALNPAFDPKLQPAAAVLALVPEDAESVTVTDFDQLQATLATARLGDGRQDLFDRLGLDNSVPAFTSAFSGGAADPLTGRIGYVMTDPSAAARLTLDHRLPFAACS